MEEIFLNVKGMNLPFSKITLSKIVTDYYTDRSYRDYLEAVDIQKAEENVWYEVKPSEIPRALFCLPRKDPAQEMLRLIINEAFEFIDRRCRKSLVKDFKVLVPKHTEFANALMDFSEFAKSKEKGHMATKVEWALYMAQRIANKDTWLELCNQPDNFPYYRAIYWDEDKIRVVGGSLDANHYCSASTVGPNFYSMRENVVYVVPLIVSYNKI